MPGEGRCYNVRDERLGQLDRRGTGYRFDLEAAPSWERIDEPGRHAPTGLLADMGIDVAALGPHAADFDWIFGAALCRSFSQLERWVIDFVGSEQGRMLPSRSLDSLLDEEHKHVEMFDRYEQLLLDRRDRALFERLYAPARARIAARHERMVSQPDSRARHYVFWLNLLFFEEFTIYLDDKLQAERAAIQPTWLAIHRLHRIEEMQHLATDEAYVAAIDLPPERRRELAQLSFISLFQLFHDTVALSPGLARLQELGCGPVLAEPRLTRRPVFGHFVDSPIFRRTRAAAPNLREILGR